MPDGTLELTSVTNSGPDTSVRNVMLLECHVDVTVFLIVNLSRS